MAAIIASFKAAYDAKDAAALRAVFTDDGKCTNVNGTADGGAEIEGFFAEFFKSAPASSDETVNIFEVPGKNVVIIESIGAGSRKVDIIEHNGSKITHARNY